MKRHLCLSILVLFFVGCAAQTLKVDQDKIEELSENKEYDKLVQVKPIEPPPAPTPEAPKAQEDQKQTSTQAQKKTKSTKKSKPKKASKKAQDSKIFHSSMISKSAKVRLPSIEDSEGFVGRRPTQDPFRVGEKMTFMMTYFGVSAGDMSLELKPMVEVNGRKAYHMYVKLKSSDLFSLFYSVDDYAETFIDYETLVPFNFHIHAVETKKVLIVKTAFDWKKLQGYRWERQITKEDGTQEKNREWEILSFSQNVISGFYYLRNFTLKPGKKIQFRVADDGKNMVVKADVLRREKIKTALGEFNTLVVKPTVEIEGIFQPMGDVFFWVTDDDRKLFVKIEAEIKIGKVIGKLKELKFGSEALP